MTTLEIYREQHLSNDSNNNSSQEVTIIQIDFPWSNTNAKQASITQKGAKSKKKKKRSGGLISINTYLTMVPRTYRAKLSHNVLRFIVP